jgi:hypothetical protein
MSNTNTETMISAADLQRVVDAYGADRTRWPAPDRLRFAAFIASDARARAIMTDAETLDRLLDSAPTVSGAREHALAARIVASVPGSVVAVPAMSVVTMQRRPTRMMAALRRPAAALLAASLVLGIVVGASGISGSALNVVAETFGVADDEPEYAQIGDSLGGDEIL